MRVLSTNSCVTSRDEFIGDSLKQWCLSRQGESRMFIRKSFCAAALILLTAGSFAAPSFAARAVGNVSSVHSKTTLGKHLPLRNTAPRRQSASTRGSKHGQRSIIFVGGRKGRHGAATRSNPTAARKSNGSLNPQPIPPGKQRKH
jgi:hypothetical protein